MTPTRFHNLRPHLKFILSRAALCLCMATLAVSTAGCMAASLAPLALQALGMLGNAVGETAQAGTMIKHGNDKNPDETEVYEETAFDNSDFDSTSSKNPANANKCNELELITPSIIEFRTDRTGSTQWRELGLGGSANSPRWTVVAAAAKDTPPGGWSPASNLGHMDFNPPLKTSSTPGDDSFLAYAPASSITAIERDQLTSLVLDFGPAAGTFQYNGRIYKYATLTKLPCFPVPQ